MTTAAPVITRSPVLASRFLKVRTVDVAKLPEELLGHIDQLADEIAVDNPDRKYAFAKILS